MTASRMHLPLWALAFLLLPATLPAVSVKPVSATPEIPTVRVDYPLQIGIEGGYNFFGASLGLYVHKRLSGPFGVAATAFMGKGTQVHTSDDGLWQHRDDVDIHLLASVMGTLNRDKQAWLVFVDQVGFGAGFYNISYLGTHTLISDPAIYHRADKRMPGWAFSTSVNLVKMKLWGMTYVLGLKGNAIFFEKKPDFHWVRQDLTTFDTKGPTTTYGYADLFFRLEF